MSTATQLRLFDTEISVPTAARMLGTSERTIHAMIEEGRLRAYRLTDGGWYRVSYESLVDYMSVMRSRYLGDSFRK